MDDATVLRAAASRYERALRSAELNRVLRGVRPRVSLAGRVLDTAARAMIALGRVIEARREPVPR